jgi:hypothetical protein
VLGMSKYNNVKTNGFDSKLERDCYLWLLSQYKAEQIQKQVKFVLFKGNKEHKLRPCTYIADFVVTVGNTQIIYDAKGVKTKEYVIKKKWLFANTGFLIKEFTRC